MTRERRSVIIKEIKYWKENNLLPSTYCDFLLMLYTEGDNAETPELLAAQRKPPPWFVFLFMLLISSLMGMSVIVIYFTSLSPQVQILIQFLIVLCVSFLAVYMKKRDTILYHICLIAGILIIFFVSTNSVRSYFEDNFVLSMIIIFNCVGWIIGGRFIKATYLKWTGTIGVALTVLIMLYYNA